MTHPRAALGLLALISILLPAMALAQGAAPPARPNILWIVSEDNHPYLGCYGDTVARTPTIDALAKAGVLYENCFATAPVCAPSRFTLITGLYATSCGPGHNMRASARMPPGVRGFPAYLREAGYYTTNNAKTDYNAPIDLKDAWDASGRNAHWRNRPAGKPFFAVFNHEVTHESSVFGKYLPLPDGTSPADVRIPAYCPDTPETRADRALYYDQQRRLDVLVARLLAQLKEDGLDEETIVFYYGDNGGVLPRSKRFAYDSGLRVPLIARYPKKWQHLAPAAADSRVDAPVSFVDFAPTVLSLAGVKAPPHFQGRAFAGAAKGDPREYAFSHRDRMDERYDLVRTARDKRYRYIRNYRPDVPWGQHVRYMFQQAGYRAWERLYKEGKLNDVQRRFWGEKPAEELYDLRDDPDEVKNLADSPEHRETLDRMRAALRKHLLDTRDNGFLPEGSTAEGWTASRDDSAYPLERVLALADLATTRDPANLPKLTAGLTDVNDVIRYWSALGCLMVRDKAAAAAEALARASDDPSPHVRVIAAEALCRIGQNDRGLPALRDLLKHENPRVRLQAVNALDHLGPVAKPLTPDVQTAARDADDYVQRAARYTAAVLTGQEPPRENQ